MNFLETSEFYSNEIKPLYDFIDSIDFKHPEGKTLKEFIFTHQHSTGISFNFLDDKNEVPEQIKQSIRDKFKELYP